MDAVIRAHLGKGSSTQSTEKQCIKRNKLLALLTSIVDNPEFRKEIKSIAETLGIATDEIKQEFLNYNLDIHDPQGNGVYRSLSNRLVLHIHNLISGSWHIERQETVSNFFKWCNPKSAIDIGFGVPSQYVRDCVLGSEFEASLTLCDLYEEAFHFAEVLLNSWQLGWEEKIKFLRADMNAPESLGDYGLYMFMDSIEHTFNPTACLKRYVRQSPESAMFLISLPIGPLIPRHYISWETDAEAVAWLHSTGLIVKKSNTVYVNPHIDLFAEQLGKDFHDLIVLCAKSTFQ